MPSAAAVSHSKATRQPARADERRPCHPRRRRTAATTDNNGDINARPLSVGSRHPRSAERSQVEAEAEAEQRDVPTAAYEWIVCRLECLAMGDVLGGGDNDDHNDDNRGGGGGRRALELDVREALAGMGLPSTSEGATAALIRIGAWSVGMRADNDRNGGGPRRKPWSPMVLDAARSLARHQDERQTTTFLGGQTSRCCRARASTRRAQPSVMTRSGFDCDRPPGGGRTRPHPNGRCSSTSQTFQTYILNPKRTTTPSRRVGAICTCKCYERRPSVRARYDLPFGENIPACLR